MKLTPYTEILKMTKDKLKEVMAPIRAKRAKKQAELEKLKLDEKIVDLESKIHEICAKDEINYDNLIDTLDEIALLKRRQEQFDEIIEELFPE